MINLFKRANKILILSLFHASVLITAQRSALLSESGKRCLLMNHSEHVLLFFMLIIPTKLMNVHFFDKQSKSK